jgi:hypothetical protein
LSISKASINNKLLIGIVAQPIPTKKRKPRPVGKTEARLSNQFNHFYFKPLNYHKIMQKLHLIYAFVLILMGVSCKNEQNTTPVPQDFMGVKGVSLADGRLHFNTNENFTDFQNKLTSDAKLSEQIAKAKGLQTLQSVIENSQNGVYKNLLPQSYQQILNDNAEVEIGEDLIWYSTKGEAFVVDKRNLKNLEAIKSGAISHKNKYKYGFDIIKIEQVQKPNGRTDLLLGTGDDQFNHVKQFTAVTPQAGQRRYVHQFKTFYGGPNTQLVLYLNLEWRGCCNWQNSSQERLLSYNLNVGGYFEWYEGNIRRQTPFSKYLSGFEYLTYNKGILIANISGSDYRGGWHFTVDGNIYHIINGDVANNGWNDTW